MNVEVVIGPESPVLIEGLPRTRARPAGGTRKLDQSRVTDSGWSAQRLDQARFLLVGCGAVGNEVARLLMMAGAGNLVVVDPDTVDASNLTRSILFRPEDVGRPKAAWKSSNAS